MLHHYNQHSKEPFCLLHHILSKQKLLWLKNRTIYFNKHKCFNLLRFFVINSLSSWVKLVFWNVISNVSFQKDKNEQKIHINFPYKHVKTDKDNMILTRNQKNKPRLKTLKLEDKDIELLNMCLAEKNIFKAIRWKENSILNTNTKFQLRRQISIKTICQKNICPAMWSILAHSQT